MWCRIFRLCQPQTAVGTDQNAYALADEIVQNPPGLNLVYTLRAHQPYEEDFPDGLYHFLGPSVYPRPSQSFDFVRGNRPVVYISLGTVLRGKVTFFLNCVDAFRGERVDVILSVG